LVASPCAQAYSRDQPRTAVAPFSESAENYMNDDEVDGVQVGYPQEEEEEEEDDVMMDFVSGR
jgi:hypothetical protein